MQDALSDKYLRKKAANSDRKMRPAPIPGLDFTSYYKCVFQELAADKNFRAEGQSDKS